MLYLRQKLVRPRSLAIVDNGLSKPFPMVPTLAQKVGRYQGHLDAYNRRSPQVSLGGRAEKQKKVTKWHSNWSPGLILGACLNVTQYFVLHLHVTQYVVFGNTWGSPLGAAMK